MEWDYSGRKRGRDAQKKKIGKVTEELRGKVKRAQDEECPGSMRGK